MRGIPLKDMLQGTARKTSFHNTIRQRDNNFIAAVFCVEMWRSVISVVHGNDDAQKSTDLRRGFLPLCSQVESRYPWSRSTRSRKLLD